MINVTIFSKNRTCQLDLLLRSMDNFWKEKPKCNIIYTYDNDEYKKGYEILKSKYGHNFILETNFKHDFISCQNEGFEFSTIFTDDDIFKNEFTFNCDIFNRFKNNNSILCLSLRLGKNIIENYEIGEVPQPVIMNNIWKWREGNIDWSYPMSVSGGHIYKTSDLLPLLKTLNYNQAWNVEVALKNNPVNKPYMICFDESKVFHNPINKVQVGYNNKHGKIDSKILNDKFLEGYRIKLEPFINYKNKSVHEIVGVDFERMVN